MTSNYYHQNNFIRPKKQMNAENKELPEEVSLENKKEE